MNVENERLHRKKHGSVLRTSSPKFHSFLFVWVKFIGDFHVLKVNPGFCLGELFGFSSTFTSFIASFGLFGRFPQFGHPLLDRTFRLVIAILIAHKSSVDEKDVIYIYIPM